MVDRDLCAYCAILYVVCVLQAEKNALVLARPETAVGKLIDVKWTYGWFRGTITHYSEHTRTFGLFHACVYMHTCRQAGMQAARTQARTHARSHVACARSPFVWASSSFLPSCIRSLLWSLIVFLGCFSTSSTRQNYTPCNMTTRKFATTTCLGRCSRCCE